MNIQYPILLVQDLSSFNWLRPSDAYMRPQPRTSLVQINALSPVSTPSYYMTRCWNIVNYTFGNKFQWNFNQNLNSFIQENAFDNVICKIAAILSQPQCVQKFHQILKLHPVSHPISANKQSYTTKRHFIKVFIIHSYKQFALLQ